MNKPYLIVVTGRPGSGKSTFSKAFGDEACLPVVSRDKIKEGYVHTFGKPHTSLSPQANGIASRIFKETLISLIDEGVSVIAEAAFQHGLWSQMLEPFREKARIYIVICKTDDHIAYDRYIKRGLADAKREYFHGDIGVDAARMGAEPDISPYNDPCIEGAPTIYVDTTAEYIPSISEIIREIFG